MERKEKEMLCIVGPTVRNVIEQVNNAGIRKEDIINMFVYREQVWLIYYG